MGRRLATPDRPAIEAALPVKVRAALPELCACLGIPADAWNAVPALAQVLEVVAVESDAARRVGPVEDLEPAVAARRLVRARQDAAVALGVDSETHAVRLKRGWAAAWSMVCRQHVKMSLRAG